MEFMLNYQVLEMCVLSKYVNRIACTFGFIIES